MIITLLSVGLSFLKLPMQTYRRSRQINQLIADTNSVSYLTQFTIPYVYPLIYLFYPSDTRGSLYN